MRKTGPLRVIIDVKGMAEVDEEDLKQQIVVLQEHFLFNTLNAIKGAAILEKVLLPELLDGFADCLRYQFQCFRVNKTVSFREEKKVHANVFVYGKLSVSRDDGIVGCW